MGWVQTVAKQLEKPTGLLGLWVARMMNKGNAPLQDWAIAQLDARADQVILEVGFGGGRTLQRVTDLTTRVVMHGVDYSTTMLNVASRRNRAAIRAGRVHLRQGDVANLPYDDEQFDKVISIHTIYFWPDPIQGLKQIHRVLKSDGVLILAIGPKDVMMTRKFPSQSNNFALYDTEEIVRMFEQAGFSDISVRPQPDASDVCVLGTKRPLL